MPTISFFYGITITMYWNDHPPPHLHAKAGGELMVVNILTLEVRQNTLPARQARLVLQWADQHRAELMEAWDLCRQKKEPHWIEPLP